MIFADAGAWGAIAMEADENHGAASRWYYTNRERLFTTDYVVDETLTLLRARGAHRQALIYGAKFFSGHLAVVHRLTDAEYVAAWEVFRRYDDKEWSFTDCTSKVVMEARGLRRAFTFDSHFKQFGSVIVVP
jgi:predicted nucleic acid-binding protein